MCLSLPALAADEALEIQRAAASSYQSGEGIARSYDGDLSTLWHSSYNNTTFPVNVTFVLKENSHVDYVKYIPRQTGTNGNWIEVTVYISSSATTTHTLVKTEVTTVNLGGLGSTGYIYLGDEGVDDVRSIRLCIKSGNGNWASAAEIGFYKADRSTEFALKDYFTDNLCTELKSDVTTAEGIEDSTVCQLVSSLLTDAEGYKKYRVAEFEPYETLSTLRNRLRVSAEYCAYENPTGIYFNSDETIYVIVDGIDSSAPVSLIVKNWGKANDNEAQSQSNFPLRNGINKITPTHRGNSYVSYYSNNYETLPNVKLHFINAHVNGYFDLQRGDTNDDWKTLLKNAVSDILDVRTQRLQVAFPTDIFKSNCPSNGRELAEAYDQIVYREREVMGLQLFNREPKNRQFFRVVHNGFMFADNTGAAVVKSSVGACISSNVSSLDFWGMAHELGHNNQLKPGLKWVGCGETTNNIYSAWVQYNLGNKNKLRLEDEVTGIDDYSGMRGGRFEAYLEQGVRKGISWQLQDGPDYHGTAYNTKTVNEQDYNGNVLSKTTTVQTRNFDHFLKVVPLWQLQLYTHLAGRSPNMYGKVMEALRKTSDSNLSNGQLQIQFMRIVCDSTQMNFLPFFEKCGILKPINAYIEDYGSNWLKINETMINNLKKYVEEKGYAEITDEVNYITAHNWQTYANRLPLEGSTLGTGCSANGSRVRVSHNIWKNAVAFETYNSKDSLIRITMYGLGSDDNHNYTQVLYPRDEDAAYIVAVGYDGERIRCYEAVSEVFTPGNKYYRLRSQMRSQAAISTAGIAANAEGEIDLTTASKVTTASVSTSNSDVSQLWQFETTSGGYYIVSPNTNLAIGGSAGSKVVMMDREDAGVFTVTNVSDNAWLLNNKSNGQYINSFNGSNSTEVGFWSGGASDNNNLWMVEEVEQLKYTINTTLWGTLHLPFAVNLPDGLTAYTAVAVGKENGNDVLILSPLASCVIPAFTPVLVNGAKGTYSLEILCDDATEAPADNLLHGTLCKRMGFESGSIATTLRNSSGVAGLYISTATTALSNRCYMLSSDIPEETTPEGGLVLSTTAIDGVQKIAIDQLQTDDTFYDLSGRKVLHPHRGIYITGNGKKVIMK